jgi:hypothetical protein
MDPSRLYVMILTSPPSLTLSRPWAGFGVLWPSQSHPVTQGLPVLESLPFNSISVPGYKNLTTDIISHSFLTTTDWILPAHTPRSFPPFLPCLASHFRQGRVASVRRQPPTACGMRLHPAPAPATPPETRHSPQLTPLQTTHTDGNPHTACDGHRPEDDHTR